MTRDEFEAELRRLDAAVEADYAAFNCARDHWDGLCRERRDLRWQWQQQRKEVR